jgi:hypothetical protein
VKPSLLIQLLNQPSLAESFSTKDWEFVVRQCVVTYLSATLWIVLNKLDLLGSVHPKALAFLRAEFLLVGRQNALTNFELGKIHQALHPVENKVILLKGAAYIALKLPLAEGRRISDIDILIAQNNLITAERELIFYGWAKTKTDDYDQRYYREWMHEIPPLQHRKRGTVIDVHHNILPPVLKRAPKAEKLLASAIHCDVDSFYVLQPIDMILHSACHLFAEGEFEKGIRDLYDLHQLFGHYEACIDDFWITLFNRAEELHLERSIYLAMHYTQQIFCTRIPASAFTLVEKYASPNYIQNVIDYFFLNIFVPHHASCHCMGFKVAKFILYWRGHLKRMPLRLLLPHILRKSFRKLLEKKEDS